jgi:hypothetical protein
MENELEELILNVIQYFSFVKEEDLETAADWHHVEVDY